MTHHRRIFLLVLFALELAGCHNNPSVENKIPDTLTSNDHSNHDTLQIETQALNCYRYVLKRDTILLQLQQRGDSITGVMSFDNYQKDSSHGDIKGHINKDTIYVLYNFLSEGMRSVMEIALLRTDSSLIRGIGPMINKADTLLYKDHQTISYKSGQKLDKVNCDNTGKFIK